MMKYVLIGGAVTIAVLGTALWLLLGHLETVNKRIGALETSNKQLVETVNAKTKATQGRADSDRSVRGLAPPDVLDRLR